MRKICVILPTKPGIGGISKASCFVANCLSGINNKVIIIGPKSKQGTMTINSDIQWIDFKERDFGKYNFFKKIFFKIAEIISFRKLLKKIKPDCVLTFGANNLRSVLISSIGKKCRIVSSERGNPGRYSRRQLKIYNRNFDKCDAVVFLTEEAKNSFDLKKPLQAVIPNPAIQRITSLNACPMVKKQILLCGSLTTDKNFSLAIDAFNLVKDKIANSMVIYGDGPLLHTLEKKIEDFDLSDRVFIKKPIPDVFYKECGSDFFVLSSIEEGMPNVLLEAMSLGIPAISTDCNAGGAKAIIGPNNERGILVKNNNVNELADAFLFMSSNSTIRNHYSNKAKEVLNLFSPELISREWNDLIEKVVK